METTQNVTQSGERQKSLIPFGFAMVAFLISQAGSQMTQFAVITWAWQLTGSTVATGLMTVLDYTTVVLLSVIAGALIDRWNRKRVIIATDIAGFIASGVVLLLYTFHLLQPWHLALFGMVFGVTGAFQFPAYLASITEMVSQENRARANGMFQLTWSISGVTSVALAGILFAVIGVTGILFIDLFTFLYVIVTIGVIRIPQPEQNGDEQTGSLWQDVVEGFRYLFGRPGLLGTVLIFTSYNVAFGAYLGLFRPMVLTLTSNNEATLGLALASVGIGSILGGLLMTVWGGPKGNRIPLLLLSWCLDSFFAFVIGGLGRNLVVWLIAGFFMGFFTDVAMSPTFAIWQDTIDPTKQGRVFGIIRLVFQGSIPIATAVATFLFDRLVGPSMQAGGSLTFFFGWLLGTGTGAGMSLLLIAFGLVFGMVLPLLCFFIPVIRKVDEKRLSVALPQTSAVSKT